MTIIETHEAGDRRVAALEQRLHRLEARLAIEDLKYRYWRACDGKDPAGFTSCFVRVGADLDYGPLGSFDSVADLVGIFERIALAVTEDGTHMILDMHHGIHPHIEFVSDTEATGVWTLRFRQLNMRDRTEKVLHGEYEDRYVVEDGQWRIQKHHFHLRWAFTKPLPEGVVVAEG